MLDEDEREKAVEMLEKYGTDPDQAARMIVRGIERNKRRVLMVTDAHASAWLKRGFPIRLQRMLTFAYRKAGVSGMKDSS